MPTRQGIMDDQEKDELMFDEFGNLLNDDSGSSSDSESDMSLDHESTENTTSTAIVKSEESNTNLSLSKTFDPSVETIIASVDTKSLNEPIVEPNVEKKFLIEERNLPHTDYSKEYMWRLTFLPERVRNVALCGNLHAGKTSLLDMLVEQTHTFDNNDKRDKEKPLRYTDNHILEIKKGISIKSSVMSMLLPDMKDSSTVVNFIDTPGHSNFCDEIMVGARLADIIILCVDVVESVTKTVELVIEAALKMKTKIVLMITKIDRLLLELRLPTLDAYYKIRRTIEQVNETITNICQSLDLNPNDENVRLSPELDNVCFSSSVFNLVFNLKSFTQKYIEQNNLSKNVEVTVDSFSTKLWGDIYYENRKFFVKPKDPLACANSRTFIKFILEPIYKLATVSLTLDAPDRKEFTEQHMKLRMKNYTYKLDSKPFLKHIFTEFFGSPSKPLLSALKNTVSPKENSDSKLEYLFTGPKNSDVAHYVHDCSPSNPLVANVVKLVDTHDSEHFYALVRVFSGTLKCEDTVRLLDESNSSLGSDSFKMQKISKCYMWCGRYRVEVTELRAGSIGLISGPAIDQFIVKTATIYDKRIDPSSNFTFKQLEQTIPPVFKVALQAYNPKELNKFLDALKKLNRSYIGCEVSVEDNGEHSILGYGELYMDCLLHDLRILYGGIDIKVSDPMVRFNETTDELSKIKLTTKSNNGKNSISIIAEPLAPEIANDIRRGILSLRNDPPRQFAKKLRDKYKWDSLAARSVWSFGPADTGTSILCDDTLPEEVDKDLLKSYKSPIVKGFQWAVKEGPLCDDVVSEVKFTIIDVQLAPELADRNDAQIIQMVRKACHAALLIGAPKLLEPIYQIESICHVDALGALDLLLERRRGFVIGKERIEGSLLWKVNGIVPVIESVGLEVDLRLSTRGLAYPQMIFSRWDRVPGNPLDDTVFIPLLKRVPLSSTARDFMMKTRRRKGLKEDVSLQNYVDRDTWNMLMEIGAM